MSWFYQIRHPQYITVLMFLNGYSYCLPRSNPPLVLIRVYSSSTSILTEKVGNFDQQRVPKWTIWVTFVCRLITHWFMQILDVISGIKKPLITRWSSMSVRWASSFPINVNPLNNWKSKSICEKTWLIIVLIPRNEGNDLHFNWFCSEERYSIKDENSLGQFFPWSQWLGRSYIYSGSALWLNVIYWDVCYTVTLFWWRTP